MKTWYAFTCATGAIAGAMIFNGFFDSPANQNNFILSQVAGSENWSGYVDTSNGQPYTDITGSWTVPSITGSEKSANAQWIGLGGVLSQDLLQMGTLETIQNGQAVDELFWEKLPKTAVEIAQVQPGDTVNTEIKYVGGNQWQLIAMISNGTQTTTKRVNVTVGSNYAQGIEQTAEWITEDPENGQNQIVPMANAGTVTFNDATVNQQPIEQANASTQQTVLVDPLNNETVQPTDLSNNGMSFSTVPSAQSVLPIQIPNDSGAASPFDEGEPSITVPFGNSSIQQVWQQMMQMQNQLNQWLQQLQQSPQSNPVITLPSPMDDQSNSWQVHHLKTREWSGHSNGWNWTVQVTGNE